MFSHLHGHSTYSLLEGIGKVYDIIGMVKELGMEACALTDYHGLYGSVEFYDVAKNNGIKPIIGIETYLSHDLLKSDFLGYFCLLAKDFEGYSNLIKVVSLANTIGNSGYPKVDLATLSQYSKGLIFYAGGVNSFIGKQIIQGQDEKKTIDFYSQIIDIFGKQNTFLEIIAQDYSIVPNVDVVNRELRLLAHTLGIELICNSNFHYISSKYKEAYEYALCIKDGKKIFDTDRRKVVGDFHIFSEQEMIQMMKKNGFEQDFIEKLFSNNAAIVQECDLVIPLNVTYFPSYQTPEKYVKFFEEYKDLLVV